MQRDVSSPDPKPEPPKKSDKASNEASESLRCFCARGLLIVDVFRPTISHEDAEVIVLAVLRLSKPFRDGDLLAEEALIFLLLSKPFREADLPTEVVDPPVINGILSASLASSRSSGCCLNVFRRAAAAFRNSLLPLLASAPGS